MLMFGITAKSETFYHILPMPLLYAIEDWLAGLEFICKVHTISISLHKTVAVVTQNNMFKILSTNSAKGRCSTNVCNFFNVV